MRRFLSELGSSSVSGTGRLLDLASALLFTAGAGLYGYAWYGFRRLEVVQPVSDDPTHFAAMARFHHFWEISRAGMGLMVAAGVTAVVAVVLSRLLPSREPRPLRKAGDELPTREEIHARGGGGS